MLQSSEKRFYGKKFLNEECTSKKFLEAVSYNVDLSEILKIKKTCAYHKNMKYAPVLLEIMVQRIKDFYRGNYLLQLWDNTGNKVYEKVLKYEVISWNIFHQYLVFKTDHREDQKHWLYIVDFKQDFKEIKVKNFVTDPSYQYLGINQDLLYYANRDVIKVVDIKCDLKGKPLHEIEPTSDQILTYEIKTPCKLHGFFENGFSMNDQYIMCLIETSDNQIDFARLYFWSRDIKNPDLEFYQYREVVHRDLRNDPIQKISQVILGNEFQYGLVHRTSGKVDLYWNYTLTSTVEEPCLDIGSNYTSLFIKQQVIEKGQMKMMIHDIELKWDSRISMDCSESYEYLDKYWLQIKDIQIRDFVKIFSSMTLVNTTFMVSYNNIVSTFDIIKRFWLDHFFMEEEVVDLLRNQVGDAYSTHYFVGILLKSGKIIPIEFTAGEEDTSGWKLNRERAQNIGSGLVKVVSDCRDISSHYIFTENNGLKLQLYQWAEIRPMDIKLKEGDQLVRFLSKDEQEDFAIFNKSDNLMKVYQNKDSTIEFKREIKLADADKIVETPHTIVESHDNGNVFMFDLVRVYMFNIEKKEMTIINDMNITGLQFLDGEYIYTLTNDCSTKNLRAGFYFYDLDQLAEKAEESFNFKLKKAIVGRSALLDYYKQDERIAYQESFESIKIVPLLHRNTINLIGMQERDNYKAFLKSKDKLIALDKQNVLTTWNICTGKVKGQFKLRNKIVDENFKTYQDDMYDFTYLAEWYQPRLLVMGTTEVQVDEAEYFKERLYLSLPNNTSYVSMEAKSFREFKLIEIMSETEVKEHFTFVHPYYGGTYQKIFFSTDLNYMIERLLNQRVFLYQRETTLMGETKWKLIRRLRQFPLDLSECTQYNYLFSPDLMLYLDYDKSQQCFLIKKSLDQSVYCQIPKGIMNPVYEDPKNLGKRFRWVTNSLIKIINYEGIEKLIDIQNGFKDINQCTVPMISLKEQKEDKWHYYFSNHSKPEGDVLGRLTKKYQKYNSVMCLDNIQDKDGLYDTLYEIDYGCKNYKGKVVIDMSYTFLHWKLAELLSDPLTKIKVKKFSVKDIQIMTLNIFPKGHTVLHYSYKNLTNIRKIFQSINNYNSELADDDIEFEVPFVQNFKGWSPLHYCVNDNNFKSAEVFLINLASTELDSHGRAIVDCLPQMVEAGVPSFGTYLDKRLLQTQQLIAREAKRGAIKYFEDLDYAVATCELWPDNDHIDELLFHDGLKNPKQSELRLEFLDMPKLHSYSEEVGDRFFKALADSDDIELFQYKSIQALIDYKWPMARNYTVKILFLPFICYLAAFITYSNVFSGQYAYQEDNMETGSMWIAHHCIAALNYLFSIYFLSNEVRQVWVTGLDYFKSVWNYTDLLPPMLIIVTISLKLNIFYNENYEHSNFLYTVHSLASLLMWVKLLYFLRIFKSTSYLVRTLTDVLYDMKVFLFILFIVYFGFGEAFLRLSEKSDEEFQFIENYAMAWVYTFRLSLGDNATDTFDGTIQNVTLWILFVICGILTNIVMLNLLISIISESFGNITAKAKEFNYQERARIISENGYLIPKYIKNSLDDFDKYIILANEVVENQDDEKTVIQNQVKNMEDQLSQFKDQVGKKQQVLEEKLDSLLNQ